MLTEHSTVLGLLRDYFCIASWKQLHRSSGVLLLKQPRGLYHTVGTNLTKMFSAIVTKALSEYHVYAAFGNLFL
jgi:hypothetical protein